MTASISVLGQGWGVFVNKNHKECDKANCYATLS